MYSAQNNKLVAMKDKRKYVIATTTSPGTIKDNKKRLNVAIANGCGTE